jgi:NAD(P) transhydrogenase subunit beta
MFAAASWISTADELAYMVAAALFTLGVIRLGKVRTAKQGNLMAAWGMGLAVAATVMWLGSHARWGGEAPLWALCSGVLGAWLGWWMAVKVPMTSMPEFVAFFNGLGGLASMLVALAEVPKLTRLLRGPLGLERGASLARFGGADFAVADSLAVIIGAVTFSGSMVAYGKLAGKIQRSRLGPLGSLPANASLGVAASALAVWAGFVADRPVELYTANISLAAMALMLGLGLTLPIGGADMPVAIALLNAYSGIAGMTTGFVLHNNLLIVAGSLVGASGIILTQVMCKAMNRSLGNVLLGALQADAGGKKDEGYTKVKTTSAEEVAPLLDAAASVIFVPGYGLAVAQAQHKVRELANLLEKKGVQVRYAIHPVAGRMPGHMNILLAEADVPFEQLYELERINDDFKNTDVVIVLGANDVCNPAAINDPRSPIAGMPVLEVWNARTVVVVKRSLAAGYAGIRNELFQMDNSLMLLADAKKALEDLVTELKSQ